MITRFGDGHYRDAQHVKVLDFPERLTACARASRPPPPLRRFFEEALPGPFKKSSDLKREHLLRCSIDPWRPLVFKPPVSIGRNPRNCFSFFGYRKAYLPILKLPLNYVSGIALNSVEYRRCWSKE